MDPLATAAAAAAAASSSTSAPVAQLSVDAPNQPPPRSPSPPPRQRRHSLRADDSLVAGILPPAPSSPPQAQQPPSPPQAQQPPPPQVQQPPLPQAQQSPQPPLPLLANADNPTVQPIDWHASPQKLFSPGVFQNSYPGIYIKVDPRNSPAVTKLWERSPLKTRSPNVLTPSRRYEAQVNNAVTPTPSRQRTSSVASSSRETPVSPASTVSSFALSPLEFSPLSSGSQRSTGKRRAINFSQEDTENTEPLTLRRVRRRLNPAPITSSPTSSSQEHSQSSASMPGGRFSKLPIELWIYIFKHLTRSDIASAMQVCRPWYDAVHRHGEGLRTAWEMTPQPRGVVPSSFIKMALKSGVTDMFLPTMLVLMDSPEGVAPFEMSDTFPALTRLNLNEARAATPLLNSLFWTLPNLQGLDLYACRTVLDTTLSVIGAFCHNLKHINLSGTDVTVVGIASLLQDARKLRTLFVSWCPNLMIKRAFDVKFNQETPIKALDISGCHVDTLHAVQLIQHSQQLEYLGVNDCSQLMALLPQIRQLRHLKYLSINRSYQVDRNELVLTLHALPALRVVSMVGFSTTILELVRGSLKDQPVRIFPLQRFLLEEEEAMVTPGVAFESLLSTSREDEDEA